MKNYKVIDISWPINKNTVEYKNKGILDIKTSSHPEFISESMNYTNSRYVVQETYVTLDMHTGTHIDAPIHFIENAKTVDKISFDYLIGNCKVFNLPFVEEKIVDSDLQKLDIDESDIILFKTKNSEFPSQGKFETNFVYLDKTAAKYLASKKIKTVGIDYLGIERNQPEHETHKILFESNVTIIEGLRLADVIQGKYFLICLPIRIEGVDAACSRAVLLNF